MNGLLRMISSRDKPQSFYRNHILLPIFISCTGWNMIRRTLGEAAPILIKQQSLTQSDYALMNTVAFVIYGVSKFITSHVAKGNLFNIYSIIFLLVGIVSIIEGYVVSVENTHFYTLLALWTLNYALMGTLWPIICIIIKNWLPDEVRGCYWSIICCCSSIGTIVCNSISQYVHQVPSSIFVYIGVIVLFASVATFFLFPRYEDKKSYAALPSTSSEFKESSKATFQEILSIILLLVAVFISTLNQRVVTDWGLLMFPQILREPEIAKNSSAAISYIEIGGILGTLWCGWFSDTYTISRALICEIMSVIAGIFMYIIPAVSSLLGFHCLCFLLGFSLYIPFSFSELIAIESVDSKHAGFIISMNGLMSPFGSVFSGIPVDFVISQFGWNTIPIILFYSFVLFTVLLGINNLLRKQYGDSKDI